MKRPVTYSEHSHAMTLKSAVSLLSQPRAEAGSNSAILVKEINNNMTESLKFLDEVGLTYGRLKISKSGH